MNNGPLIFLGVLASFVASWWTLVFVPHWQLGRQKAAEVEGLLYPKGLPGVAQQGRQVYVANGCVQCHSQQVQQDGYTFDVVLTGGGTNPANVANVLGTILRDGSPGDLLAKASDTAPQPVLRNVAQRLAEDAQKRLKSAGAQAQVVFIPVGADMARKWGTRRSVAADYLYDYPVQVGNSRLGPDLANEGSQPRDKNWHLVHLYAPRAMVNGSMMPAFKYLFEERPKGKQPSPQALSIPEQFAPKGDLEVIPTEEALQLVAYLQSLRVDTQLFEAPMTQITPASAPAPTNAPAATNAAATPAAK